MLVTGALLAVAVLALGEQVSQEAEVAPQVGTRRSDVPDFLAAFLGLQAQTIAPAFTSGFTCTWGREDVATALWTQGIRAHLHQDENHPVINGSATVEERLPPPLQNVLFNPVRVPEEELKALINPSVRQWMQALRSRGAPGVPEEQILAEEVFLDLSCPSASLLLKIASDMNLFRRPFRWVLLMPICSKDAVVEVTPRAALVDSQVTVACVQEGLVEVFEVYRPALGMAAESLLLASWRDQHLQLHQLLRGDIRRNLKGVTISTGIALLDSNQSVYHLTDGREKPLDQLTKTTFTVLLQAYELMNATSSLHVTNSHGYVRNGTYDGLLGEMYHGVVEVGATCMVLIPFRMMVVSYSTFSIPIRGVFVFRQPALAYTDNVFRLPFPNSLWAAATGLVTLCCAVALLAISVEQHYQDGDRGDGEDFSTPSKQLQGAGKGAPKSALKASFSDVFLLAFGAICQQGSPVEARGTVGRIVTFTLFVAVLLLYTCYTASVVVLLQSSSNSIRTFRDLWKSRLEVGGENLPFNVYLFELIAKTGDEARHGIYVDKVAARGKRKANFMSMAEGVRRIRDSLFAFCTVDSSMYGHIQATFEESEKCDLFELSKYSIYEDPNLVSRRDSPISHLLKMKLLLQWERGFRSRFNQRCLYTRPKCDSASQGARFTSITIVSVRGAYYLLVGGMAAAFVIWLAELIHFRATHDKQQCVRLFRKKQ